MAIKFTPSYLKLSESQFNERIQQLYDILRHCELCPRKCGVDRLNKTGYCNAGYNLRISYYGPHHGEEDILVGNRGSGTIFLSGCSLRCVYCQNYSISILGEGKDISEEECAGIMLQLQNRGCHNINLVTPTHFAPQLVKALSIAAHKGLRLPVVWNCGGYENVDVIYLLEDIVDIYMPDIKYSRRDSAVLFSNAEDYFERCKEAVKEMHRQVGDLEIEDGIARRGLLIRHLVLPEDLAGSEAVLSFIAREISPHSYVNVMGQYYPRSGCPVKLNRRITDEEFRWTVEIAKKLGLRRGLQ
jgi:putative pyruvate formate lyase activating enzyme